MAGDFKMWLYVYKIERMGDIGTLCGPVYISAYPNSTRKMIMYIYVHSDNER